MKKFFTFFSLFTIATLSQEVSALEYRPYFGIGYAADHINYKATPTNINMNSYTAFIGSEYNKYFGTEVFYQQSTTWNKVIKGNKISSDFYAYGLDTYTYLPLGCEQRIAPFATLGVSGYEFGKDNKDWGLGYRMGGGLQYKITDNIAIRALGRYILTDKLDNIDHISEFSINLKYVF